MFPPRIEATKLDLKIATSPFCYLLLCPKRNLAIKRQKAISSPSTLMVRKPLTTNVMGVCSTLNKQPSLPWLLGLSTEILLLSFPSLIHS